MKRISEQVKVDVAIFPVAVSSNGTTSQYFDLTGYGKALFTWAIVLHSAGISTTSIGTVYQAQDGAGTGAAALASSTAILTASPKLTSLTLTASITLTDGNTVVIIEQDDFGEAKAALTFTCTAAGTATPTVANPINISSTAGGTGIMSTTCTNFAAVINALNGSSLYGSASTTTLVIRSRDAGDTVFSFSASNTAAFSVVSASVQGMIEVGAGALTVSSNFTHVALNVVNESAFQTSAIVLRDAPARFLCHQQAAVHTIL